MPRETGQQGQGRTTAIRESELKICELCGWLNLVSNTECFVCGWHGRFETDPEVVHAAVELAVRRYGRLELQHLTDPSTYRQPRSSPPLVRLGAWLRQMWHRLLHR
ncbi:MAG TPA: hypothetical protein VKU00_13035 [Chthonomonadaceae bacterium]|nr:hypothetical protein [Chthonomonadaceae bacterium]